MVTRSFWLFNHATRGDIPTEEIWAGFDQLIIEQPERFAVASSCGFAATAALMLADWDATARFVYRGFVADPGAEFGFWSGQFYMQIGVLEILDGNVDRGLENFAKGKAMYTGLGAHSGMPCFESSAGLAAARQGRIAEAETLVRAARDELDTHQEMWGEPAVLLAEAELAYAKGDRERARAKFAETIEVSRQQGADALVARSRARAEELGLDADLEPTA
jgi:hypothetical protein